jgi:hypothetical protein
MIESNVRSRNYAIAEGDAAGRDRLAPGSALLAVFGLSLLAWAVVLLPLLAILQR